MGREQYLIIFTGKNWSDELVEDVFFDKLTSLQSSFNYKSVSRHQSDLVDLTFNYYLQINNMTHLLDGRTTWAVIKIMLPSNTMMVNKRLDRLFRECVSEFDDPIYSTCYYFIERNGRAGFHRVSRAYYDGEYIDDDHLDMDGFVAGHPSLFFNHFYSLPYTDEQNAEIAKRMLVAGGL
ncbi:MAG: hypothetical protein PQJ35_00720 [Sphaerochaetaceae bacterium]|nr:hypothetical protein [Sphaerochaetaceae bacterium]